MTNRTLMVFSIGPVQSFIAAARKVEDLWSGSYILSYLTEEAIIKCYELAEQNHFSFQLISPYITYEQLKRPIIDSSIEVASLPNRFVGELDAPEEAIVRLAVDVEQHVRCRFHALCNEAVEKVFNTTEVNKEELLKLQKKQVDNLLEIYWTIEKLGNHQGDYNKARLALESRLAAIKNDLPFWKMEQSGIVCTVCNEREALHDIDNIEQYSIGEMRNRLKKMWRYRGHEFKDPRIKDDELLCSVCLAKRYARQYFRELKTKDSSRFFGKYPSIEEIVEPLKYYAVIMFDGDNMGKFFAQDGDGKPEERQQELSKKLSVYSMEAVPQIIERHKGKLVYAGGDDVLAFLPMDEALDAAKELRIAFASPEKGLGEGASLSGAICIAHIKTPLQYILSELRKLEKKSKEYKNEVTGQEKDSFTIATYTSGEIRSVTLPWRLSNGDYSSDYINVLSDALGKDLASTFLYTLQSEFMPLIGSKLDQKIAVFNAEPQLNKEMLQLEFSRLINRAKTEESAIDAGLLAQKFVELHDAVPDTLNFIHLLEIARFIKRKKDGQTNERLIEAN